MRVSSTASVEDLAAELRPAYERVARGARVRRGLGAGYWLFACVAYVVCGIVPHVVGILEYGRDPWIGMARVWSGFFFWPIIYLPFALLALRRPLVTLLEYTFQSKRLRMGFTYASPIIAGTVLAALAVSIEVNSPRQVPWTIFPALPGCQQPANAQVFSADLSNYDSTGTLKALYESRGQKLPFWLVDRCWPNVFFYLTVPIYSEIGKKIGNDTYRSDRQPIERAFAHVIDSNTRAPLSYSYFSYVASFSILIWILAIGVISSIFFMTVAIRLGDSRIRYRPMEDLYRCLTYAFITLMLWIPFRMITLYFKKLYLCDDLVGCTMNMADYMNDALLGLILIIGYLYLSVGLLYKYRRIALSILGFSAVAFIIAAAVIVVRFSNLIAQLTDLWQFYIALAILGIVLLVALWYQFDPAVADENLIDEA